MGVLVWLLQVSSRYGNDGNHVQSGQCIMQTVTAAVYVRFKLRSPQQSIFEGVTMTLLV